MKKKIVIITFLILASIITSCTMIGLMLEEDTDKFVGRWEDEWDTTFFFEDNGNCDISESPIPLSWSIDSERQILKIWSIMWVFNIKASYEFIDDDTIMYIITDLSILAREWYDLYETNTLYKLDYSISESSSN